MTKVLTSSECYFSSFECHFGFFACRISALKKEESGFVPAEADFRSGLSRMGLVNLEGKEKLFLLLNVLLNHRAEQCCRNLTQELL